MKNFNVPEFADYCKQHRLNDFVFSTENQTERGPLKAEARFHQITFGVRPNRILLLGADVSMQFEAVREILVSERRPCIGTVIRMICASERGETVYTLLAS